MPAIPFPTAAEGALLADLLGNFYLERWPEVVEIVSKPVSIAIVAAGFLGLVVGLLLRGRERTAAGVAPAASAAGREELRWRHEKLVLVERQQVEKQARLDALADRFGGIATGEERELALRLFVLSERWREARQRVGSDLARMRSVGERLGAIAAAKGGAVEAAAACRAMAESQAGRLEEAREALWSLGQPLAQLEERLAAGPVSPESFASLRAELVAWKGGALSLPPGWATSGGEADRRLREMLATVPDPDLDAVREVLLVDGAHSSSLEGDGGIDLAGAAGAVVSALDALAASVREPAPTLEPASTLEPVAPAPPVAIAPVVGPPGGGADAHEAKEAVDAIEAAATALAFESGSGSREGGVGEFGFPDPGFRAPSEFAMPALKPQPIARGFRDLTADSSEEKDAEPPRANGSAAPSPSESEPVSASGPDSGEAEPSARSLLIFCSNDAELWGRNVYRGARCRARAVDDLPDWVRFVSIRRLDTGERVIAPLDRAGLGGVLGGAPVGFNGSNEFFYGARHLGLFSEACPNEVETRFTYGGWGFGHRAQAGMPEVEQLQAAGWEGREIPADTVFEIEVHEALPATGPLDRVLEWQDYRRPAPALRGA